MREFKSGTLKSGGSGKKVTNPKQAIAIALSEANAMNQGGMMQNPVMQRPMFQTPMQRQGLGIMAGVAPVRGYQEGGEVEDEIGFMDYLRVAPEVIGEMIVGEDDTMSDFFSFEKTPEGQGLNLRDLTDFFIVDPDDPTDVAIGTATAGLMATGVGAPGAIASRLGRMGFKGKKVADKVERAIRLGVGDTRGKTFGRGQTARLLTEVPELVAGEEEEMPAPGGIGSLMVEEPSQSDKNYNVGVSKGGVPFKESFAHHRAKGDDVFTWNGELYTTNVDDEPVEMNKGGKVGFAGLLSGLKDKTKKMLKREQKEEEEQMELFDDLPADLPADSPTRTRRAIDFAKRRPVVTGAGGVGGIALLLDQLFGDDEEEAIDPSEQLGAPLSKEEDTAQGAGFTLNRMPNLPAVVVPEEPEEEDVEVEEERRKVLPGVRPFGGKVARYLFGEDEALGGDDDKDKGFFENAITTLQDPRTRYAIAKANQPSEGFTPRNALSDMVMGAQEYDLLQKQKDDETALEQNIEALQELMPEATTDEILNLLLSKDTDSELSERIQTETLSLFSDLQDNPKYVNLDENQKMALARASVLKGMGFGDIDLTKVVSPQTGEQIPLQKPE